MNSLAGLRDIQGLDPLSFWPLAPGWWIVLAIIIIGAAISLLERARRASRRRRWQSQVLNELTQMSATITPQTSQRIAVRLAILMRRLAMHRFSREACASLEGENWLKWLNENDQSKFNWRDESGFLTRAPFAPAGAEFDLNSVRRSLEAAKGWVQ